MYSTLHLVIRSFLKAPSLIQVFFVKYISFKKDNKIKAFNLITHNSINRKIKINNRNSNGILTKIHKTDSNFNFNKILI